MFNVMPVNLFAPILGGAKYQGHFRVRRPPGFLKNHFFGKGIVVREQIY